jgi:hypothetical protein
MARITPLTRESVPQYEHIFKGMEESIGYVPNSFFTMARDHGIMTAMGVMSDAFWYAPTVDEPLRRLVTFAYSHFAGSYYSSAHCACGAEELGLAREKIMSIFDYETSVAYTEAERAVVRLCRQAARIPGEVTDGDVEAVKAHYGVPAATFITGLICFMAFLNKWNEICGTELEAVPNDWAKANLGPIGWHLKR